MATRGLDKMNETLADWCLMMNERTATFISGALVTVMLASIWLAVRERGN